MDCGYKEKVILYFYGELSGDDSAGVRSHLEACSSCAADLSVLKGLSEGLSAFHPVPPELEAKLTEPADVPAFGPFPVFMRRAATAAAAALLLAAFHLQGLKKAPSAWRSGIDSGLENIEARMYTLEDEMAYSASADFDYAYSVPEIREEEPGDRIG